VFAQRVSDVRSNKNNYKEVMEDDLMLRKQSISNCEKIHRHDDTCNGTLKNSEREEKEEDD